MDVTRACSDCGTALIIATKMVVMLEAEPYLNGREMTLSLNELSFFVERYKMPLPKNMHQPERMCNDLYLLVFLIIHPQKTDVKEANKELGINL